MKSIDDLPSFVAYAHVSERAICEEFALYAKLSPNKVTSLVFQSIRREEVNHHEGALTSLRAMVSEKVAMRLVGRAWRKRAAESFEELAGRVGDLFVDLVLGLTYFVFGPILVRYCRRRMLLRRNVCN